jgi:hypothetical protein
MSPYARLNSTAETLLRFLDEHFHGFVRNRYALAACEGCVSLIEHRDNLEPTPLAFFAERQRLVDGLFFGGEASAFDRFLNEGLLIGSQLDAARTPDEALDCIARRRALNAR